MAKSYEENYFHISIKFNIEKEADLISLVQNHENKSDYIKKLISQDLNRMTAGGIYEKEV